MPRLFHEAIFYERLRAMGWRFMLCSRKNASDGQATDALLAVRPFGASARGQLGNRNLPRRAVQ